MSLKIYSFFTGFDSKGINSEKIDTILEYQKLGEYLNGSYVENIDKNFNDLSKKEQRILQKLYKSAQKLFSNIKQGENLPVICDENVENYVELEKDLSFNNGESVILKNVRMALNKYLDENGEKSIDNEATAKQNNTANFNLNGYELIMRNIDIENDIFNYDFTVSEILNKKRKNKSNEFKALQTLQFLNSPFDNNKLKKVAEKYKQENNVTILQDSNNNIDLGNGKFDKRATQNTNICWALAGINALLVTNEGKELLENNRYFDEETGVFVIHLQEAENNNLHDGIYVITSEDIINEGEELVSGEGDVTAYAIAIKRYFDEVNQNSELLDKMNNENHYVGAMDNGNYSFRLYEIFTGGQYSEYKSYDELQLQNGIGVGTPNDIDFNFIKDVVENKKGAVTLAIAGHSISVIGVNDNNLIIQESNNNEMFDENYIDMQNNHKVFNKTDSINNAPTYTLSQYDFEGYIQGVYYLKWKE